MMDQVIALSLALLVVFLVGCLAGYGLRRLMPSNRRAEMPVVEAAPFIVETAMPSQPRPANVSLPITQPDDAGQVRVLPFALAQPRGGKADNLKQINGIGAKLESRLHEAGIFHFDQLAGLTKKTADELDAHLSLAGRVQREEWIKQAKQLAKRPARSTRKPA